MSNNIWSVALACALIIGCADANEPLEALNDGEQVETLGQEVIMDDEDWNLVETFNSSPAHRAGVRYARAVAKLETKDWRCSGFLINDDVLMTAKHCVDYENPTVNAVFGLYGATSGNHTQGLVDARKRLRRLGMPSTYTDRQLTNFTCHLIQTSHNQDIAYYRCQPTILRRYENGHTVRYDLRPGYIWGHLNLDADAPTTHTPDSDLGRDVYTISANNMCNTPSVELLFSPGVQTGREEACKNYSVATCLDVTTDWLPGSSGGPVMNLENNEVFGVVQGPDLGIFGAGAQQRHFNRCATWSTETQYWHNLVYEFRNQANEIEAQSLTYSDNSDNVGWSMGANYGVTSYLGGSKQDDSVFARTCEGDRLAIGVVGNTSSDGRVGNLGFICAPHTGTSSINLDRATVIAPGTANINGVAADNTDFNTYNREVVVTTTSYGSEQHFTLCPQGYFIKSIEGQTTSDGTLGSISAITCEDPQRAHHNATVTRTVRQGGSRDSIGTRSGTTKTITCDTPGTYLHGMWAIHDDTVNGILGFCRFED